MAFLIQDVARILRSKLDQIAAEAGLTTAQWRVIATVARCKAARLEAPNQAALAEILEVEPITLSRQIDRLAAAGLIERRPDPADRRAHRLFLTDKAQPHVDGFRTLGTKLMRDALEGISDADVDTVLTVLERLRANMTGKTEVVVPYAESEQPVQKSAVT